jgi:hypothetical protein
MVANSFVGTSFICPTGIIRLNRNGADANGTPSCSNNVAAMTSIHTVAVTAANNN